jgi:hypothetical protein
MICIGIVECPGFAVAETMLHGIGNHLSKSSALPEGARVLTVLPDFHLDIPGQQRADSAVTDPLDPWVVMSAEPSPASIPDKGKTAPSPTTPISPKAAVLTTTMPEGNVPASGLVGTPVQKKKCVKPHMIADYIDMWCNAESNVPLTGSFVGFKLVNGIAIPELL